MGILCEGMTNIGRVRKTNQDAIFLDQDNFLYIVADGMGGHQGGDIASQIATQSIPEYLKNNPITDPKDFLQKSFQFANKKIHDRAVSDAKLKGMGTTIVGFLFHKNHLYMGNVGDSRTYLINNRLLYQMTRDHTLVQEKINLGIYDREEAAKDKMKNVLVKSVGYEANVDVDTYSYKVARNDIFLLCSDGLYGKVSDRHILEIICMSIPDPQKATRETLRNTVSLLIDQANENGGQDNISVILSVTQ